MGDFKKRLIDEESQLKKKIDKLYDFSQGDKFEFMKDIQKTLLLIQLDAMRTYWRCLVSRMNLLK